MLAEEEPLQRRGFRWSQQNFPPDRPAAIRRGVWAAWTAVFSRPHGRPLPSAPPASLRGRVPVAAGPVCPVECRLSSALWVWSPSSRLDFLPFFSSAQFRRLALPRSAPPQGGNRNKPTSRLRSTRRLDRILRDGGRRNTNTNRSRSSLLWLSPGAALDAQGPSKPRGRHFRNKEV